MTDSIKFIRKNWLFDIYDKNEDIFSEEPTIALYVTPFPEGHNSNFPFKVEAVYYFKNPKSVFNNNQPRFEIDPDKKVLLLVHNYTDSDKQLNSALRLMKTEFQVETYDSDKRKI